MTYELYAPLRDHDEDAITALVALFKRLYTVVIIAILGLGVVLIPFLGYIINSPLDGTRLRVYYVLYLINAVASYFAMYRTMVIEADQQRYLTNAVDIASKIVMYVLQSIYLVLTRDFLGYLCIQFLTTILKNVTLNQIAMRKYPYIRDLSRPDLQVPQSHLTRIYTNVKAMFITKVSGVVLNQTDSIIISVLFGTIFVGYYSNYNELIIYINSIIFIIISSVEASIGNLNAEHDSVKSYEVLRRMNLIVRFINTFCVAEFVCIIQDFIVLWIGEQYVQGWDIIIALMFTFYMQNAMGDVTTFRQTMGLFNAVRKAYPIMAMLNIVLSIILGEIMGVAGVILATGLSRLITIFWYEGRVVYAELDRPMSEYILCQLSAAVVTAIVTAIAYIVCGMISIDGILGVGLKGAITAVIVTIFYWLLYHRSAEWKWGVSVIRSRLFPDP